MAPERPSAGRKPVEAARRVPYQPGEPAGIEVGDRVSLVVLGMGGVDAVVERMDELVQEGVRGLGWRVELRLPDGAVVHGIKRGHARLIFLDPRYRSAG
jgi:hypothetical protein